MSQSSDHTHVSQQNSLPSTFYATIEQLTGPQIGVSWPELRRGDVKWPDNNGLTVDYTAAPDAKRVTVRLFFTTQLCITALLATIALYAIQRHDTGLLKTVVNAINLGARVEPPSRPPP
jgi:hypothetical protein